MPKVWADTIEDHRREVADAIMHATAVLVGERGLTEVSMSAVAERAGIGRATLYKYFPTLDAIVVAWHAREVDRHLAELETAASTRGPALERLHAVLEGYARRIAHGHHGEMSAALHHTAHVEAGHARVEGFLAVLVAEAAEAGDVRDDIAPRELAIYCVHALSGARALASKAAIGRLVDVTIGGLRPS